jgi:hypothetical protein
LRDITPNRRIDRNFQTGYTWTRPSGKHNWRMSGRAQVERHAVRSNARGTFTFTGLYTSGGIGNSRGAYQDFADFLLGLPQQATRSYSENPSNIVIPILIRGKNFNAYIQDDFRWKARWTIQYGVSYNVLFPFVEANGHMVNLDAPDFSAVLPAGNMGRTAACSWPDSSPRTGTTSRRASASRGATQPQRRPPRAASPTPARSTIARNLYQQPPFFSGHDDRLGAEPLTIAERPATSRRAR